MRTKRFDYFGAFSPAEIWGKDKVEFCREVLRKGGFVNVGVPDAEERLKFYDRFDPTQPHDRTVAQEVIAYSLISPKWTKRGKLIIPQRDLSNPDSSLEQKMQMDFGRLLKKVSRNGPGSNKVPGSKYLTIYFDPKQSRSGILVYRFFLKECTIASPIELHVSDYVAIDGIKIKEQIVIHRPAFEAESQGFSKYFSSAE